MDKDKFPTSIEVNFSNLISISPLVSKCEIAVLYHGKNRNKSYITKQVANRMAETLPGVPIVGEYYLDASDFGDHGDMDLVVDKNGVRFTKSTVPYGFVPPGCKIWWEKQLDPDGIEREYLKTEGYLWTGRYPEVSRVVEKGNGQSMELHGKTLKGKWAKVDNEDDEYFIISDAQFEGLCILGEDVPPCFEGATIGKKQNLVYSLDKEDFKSQMSDFMLDLKEALFSLGEGGNRMEDIKDFEEVENTEVEVETETQVDTGETDYINKKKKDEEEEENSEPEDKDKDEDSESDDKEDSETDDKDDDDDKEDSESDEDEDKKKKKNKYNLEEVVEYQEIVAKYAELEKKYSLLNSELEVIRPEFNKLKEMKIEADNKAKEDMINSFYMLSDEDKKDVIANKANYSLDEIESKLSVICVRNKVNFALGDTSKNEDNTEAPITTFNLECDYSNAPSWLKAVDRVVKNRK